MKKLFFFAVTAAMFAACSNDELATQNANLKSQEVPVNFDVYTNRATTRSGLPSYNGTSYGVTTASLQTGVHKAGFGVFGYYTSNGDYDVNNSTPNFMYNQQVTYTATGWTYEPVKYWPNEFGDAAASDDLDKLSFFAYAPYQEVTVNTGVPVNNYTSANEFAPSGATDDFKAAMLERMNNQKLNITQVTKNTASGDPIVKYVVDFHPSTSVDLLWGVAAADVDYSGMDGVPATVQPGNCFIDMTKQNDVSKKLKWNFKHALAQLNVQICTVVDKGTPGAGSTAIGTEGDGTTVDINKTKVWLRSVTFTDGFATEGALNLHSEDVDATVTDATTRVTNAEPYWLDYDGTRDLTFEPITLYDGLKDGKEGTTNNIQKNETPAALNPVLTQVSNTNSGVPITLTNLFDGSMTADDPIYVIPTGEQMEITVLYDIETEDENLAGLLSDNVTHGSAIENKITKSTGLTIEAGKSYVVKIYLGIESVKFDVTVTDWVDGGATEASLPHNNSLASAAKDYVYPADNPYTYKGTITVNGNSVTYSIASSSISDGSAVMNDMARFLGALYRAAGVQTIKYGGNTYTWRPDLAHDLKGSNWYDVANSKTLVSVLKTGYGTPVVDGTPFTITFDADGTTMSFTFNPT